MSRELGSSIDVDGKYLEIRRVDPENEDGELVEWLDGDGVDLSIHPTDGDAEIDRRRPADPSSSSRLPIFAAGALGALGAVATIRALERLESSTECLDDDRLGGI